MGDLLTCKLILVFGHVRQFGQKGLIEKDILFQMCFFFIKPDTLNQPKSVSNE